MCAMQHLKRCVALWLVTLQAVVSMTAYIFTDEVGSKTVSCKVNNNTNGEIVVQIELRENSTSVWETTLHEVEAGLFNGTMVRLTQGTELVMPAQVHPLQIHSFADAYGTAAFSINFGDQQFYLDGVIATGESVYRVYVGKHLHVSNLGVNSSIRPGGLLTAVTVAFNSGGCGETCQDKLSASNGVSFNGYTQTSCEGLIAFANWFGPNMWCSQFEGTYNLCPRSCGNCECSEEPAATTVTTTPSAVFGAGTVSELEWEHFNLVNQLRAQGFTCPSGTAYSPNSQPLVFECKLWKASQLHSQDMANNNYFSHTSQDGRSPWDRVRAFGASATGENIAAGSGTAEGVLNQWKNSDGHCRNMGSPGSVYFAVGHGYSSSSTYKHYWTQMFGSSPPSGGADTSCYPGAAPTAVVTTTTTTPAVVTTTTTTTALAVFGEGTVSELEWEHFNLVNQLRAQGFTCPSGTAYSPNSQPLVFECKLWKASQLHSQDMANNNYFSHTSQDGRSPWDRVRAFGASATGENIAAGSGTAEGVLNQWKNSDGHCRNMGSPGSVYFAVGHGYSSSSTYKHYWTQMFGSSPPSGSADTSCYPGAATTAVVTTTTTTTAVVTTTTTTTVEVTTTTFLKTTTTAITTSTSTTQPDLTTTVSLNSKGIHSGDTIFLRANSGTGMHLDVENSQVQARWLARGGWQALVIEKPNGGHILSGDIIYLKAHAGMYIDVSGEDVQARWEEVGDWQALTIEKKHGSGAVSPNDLICLKAHTGNHLDVPPGGSVVHARWNDCGDWQTMLLEKAVPGSIYSGQPIYLVAHTGNLVDVEGTSVQARWNDRGGWQELTIQTVGGGDIFSGDEVFLQAHTGSFLDVQDVAVSARWNERGDWQRFTIEKKSGNGAILPDDTVVLRAHTGNMLDVEVSNVQARYHDYGDWQSFKVEKVSRRLMQVANADSIVVFSSLAAFLGAFAVVRRQLSKRSPASYGFEVHSEA